MEGANEYIADRRIINHFLERETKYYKFVGTQNIDAKHPRDEQYFNRDGSLTGTGYYQMWNYISDLTKLKDKHGFHKLPPRPDRS